MPQEVIETENHTHTNKPHQSRLPILAKNNNKHVLTRECAKKKGSGLLRLGILNWFIWRTQNCWPQSIVRTNGDWWRGLFRKILIDVCVLWGMWFFVFCFHLFGSFTLVFFDALMRFCKCTVFSLFCSVLGFLHVWIDLFLIQWVEYF